MPSTIKNPKLLGEVMPERPAKLGYALELRLGQVLPLRCVIWRNGPTSKLWGGSVDFNGRTLIQATLSSKDPQEAANRIEERLVEMANEILQKVKSSLRPSKR